MIRELFLRAWYATQHGPHILDKITEALNKSATARCPFCRESGFHRKRCYLVRRKGA